MIMQVWQAIAVAKQSVWTELRNLFEISLAGCEFTEPGQIDVRRLLGRLFRAGFFAGSRPAGRTCF